MYRLVFGQGDTWGWSFDEEPTPGLTGLDSLSCRIGLGGNGAEPHLCEQAKVAWPVGGHPLVGSKHLWRPAGPGRLTKHSLDLTVSDQGVEMKPDGIGMDVEPIGNLSDRDGGVRRFDQFRDR